MSTSYCLLAEGKIKNEWVCLSPYYRHEDGFHIATLYDSNSRSYFDETYQELLNISGYYDDRNNLNFSHGVNEWILQEFEDKQNCTNDCQICIIGLEEIKKNLGDANKFDFCELVKKSAIDYIKDGYDTDEDDIIISAKEYAKLPAKAQELYEVLSWDKPEGWRIHFKEIIELTEQAKRKYYNEFYEEPTEIRLVMFVY